MSHKTHPKSFRIKRMEDFGVRGFYGKKMSKYLEEDFTVRDFLENKLAEALIASIEIEHSSDKLNIIIETARPGLIIGRGGEGIVGLKNLIEKKLKDLRSRNDSFSSTNKQNTEKQIKIDIKEVKNPWISAALVAKMAAQQIEKRMPFRRVLKKSIERVMQNKEAKGVKIEAAGRLNGIEISRKEWLKEGRMPLGTLRADIDYAQTVAFCSYGSIGIKVWIYKGDKFD